MVNYVRPEDGGPDRYGIKDISKEIAAEERLQKQVYASDPIPVQSRRQWIATLIRQLTYRELKQIGEEVNKCSAGYCSANEIEMDMAQTLDNWAHMVKEEDECISGGPIKPPFSV